MKLFILTYLMELEIVFLKSITFGAKIIFTLAQQMQIKKNENVYIYVREHDDKYTQQQ